MSTCLPLDQLMTKIKFVSVLYILIITMAGCSALTPVSEPTPTAVSTSTVVVIVEPTSPPQKPDLPTSDAGVPRVPVDQAKAAVDSGAAIIVDVRSPDSYKLSHVKGAINISLGEIQTNPSGLTLDKNQWIITYCT